MSVSKVYDGMMLSGLGIGQRGEELPIKGEEIVGHLQIMAKSPVFTKPLKIAEKSCKLEIKLVL